METRFDSESSVVESERLSRRYTYRTLPIVDATHPKVVEFQVPAASLTKSHTWTYVIAGFVLFLLGAGMSIVTLVHTESVAAPMVVISTGTSTVPVELTYGSQPRLSQRTFFMETLDAFRKDKQTFVEADLLAMLIRFYKEGEMVFEAPILTKGRDGSWWETPAGLYQIQSKEKNHFSSFGHVYQPWSMAFQGNFFVHGWPYYSNGVPVSSQYSGGCIRLADTDAKALFELVDTGTPILVYDDGLAEDDFVFEVPLPTIEATAFLVADAETGTILAEHGSENIVPIASITKMMTALIAAEYLNLDAHVTITETMLATTSIPRLSPGTRMTTYSLLFPLLLESSNEAANAYAELIGEGRIVNLMNAKAKALGMEQTTYTDASGADSGNISTPHDLLRLATHIYNNRSFILKISSGASVSSAYSKYDFGTLQNFNEVPSITGLVGGKVGKTTAAQETALLFYDIAIRGEKRTLVFIVLGTPDRHAAIQTLHAYANNRYGSVSE